jgi:hypothetical protein
LAGAEVGDVEIVVLIERETKRIGQSLTGDRLRGSRRAVRILDDRRRIAAYVQRTILVDLEARRIAQPIGDGNFFGGRTLGKLFDIVAVALGCNVQRALLVGG